MNYEQVKKVVKSKGYIWFDSPKDYDLNIVGIRNLAKGKEVTNIFDDTLTVSYKIGGIEKFHEFPITTDPGKKAMKEFGNSKGVAILVPGQYRGMHGIRLHQGRYEALGQNKPCKVYRDKNKDMTFDNVAIDEGLFGINIHRSNATGESTFVENWSEGCQVFKKVADFNAFMAICHKAKDIHGNSFTYTLLESTDFE